MPPKTDMVTLAKLHAALDAVVETQELLAQVGEDPSVRPTTVTRARELVGETRELLRALLRKEIDTVSTTRAVSTP
ncbi:MAG TPA: hypothetical protein VGM39_11845 [Kofleriaceae bacterium]|jgi:hypothetical protein